MYSFQTARMDLRANINNPNYADQKLPAGDYDDAILNWESGVRDGILEYQVEWTVGGVKKYYPGQKQSGNRCGLHALNALHGLLDDTMPRDAAENKVGGHSIFPYYTVDMIHAAKNYISDMNDRADKNPGDKGFPDSWPEEIHGGGDETDPTTLTILARNR